MELTTSQLDTGWGNMRKSIQSASASEKLPAQELLFFYSRLRCQSVYVRLVSEHAWTQHGSTNLHIDISDSKSLQRVSFLFDAAAALRRETLWKHVDKRSGRISVPLEKLLLHWRLLAPISSSAENAFVSEQQKETQDDFVQDLFTFHSKGGRKSKKGKTFWEGFSLQDIKCVFAKYRSETQKGPKIK